MVSAWAAGSSRIRPEDVVARPAGIATAILRGDPSRAYPYVHAIVAESGGAFVAVGEDEIREARDLVEELESLRPCFSAAAAVAGVAKLRRLGDLPPDATVLVNLTGRDRSERVEARVVAHRRAAVR
jgi:threonine synthase